MASLLYKDFLIVAGADFEAPTRSWVSIVSVSWNAGGKQEIHFLSQTSERHDSPDDAVGFGLAVARAWVDYRLNGAE